jgi:hypothetical protein
LSGSARACLFSQQFEAAICVAITAKSVANPAILSQIICVAELASHVAATTTQVIYSASSVTERIVGSFLVAEKIYLGCVAELASHAAATATQVIYSDSSVDERIVGSFLLLKRFTVRCRYLRACAALKLKQCPNAKNN